MSPNEMISHRTIQILKQPNINYLVQAFSILLNEDCILTRYYPLIPYKDKIISFSKDNNLINKDELIQYNTLPIFNNESLDKLFKRFLIMYDNQDKLKILNKLISSNKLILDNNKYLAYLELFLLPGVKETRAEIYYLSGYKDLYSISISTVEEILNNINDTIINNKLNVSLPLIKEVKTHIAVAKAFCL